MIYTESQLIELARNNRKELARILTSPDIDVRTLIYGVEIFGAEISDEEIAVPVFNQLLRHFNALVREGAMMGVAAFFDKKKLPRNILDRLKVLATSDPSPTNKETAKSLLEDLEG